MSGDKHSKYYNSYIANDFYWGIGIENESYLEFENTKKVDENFFRKEHCRERYSVDYFITYKKNTFEDAIENLIHKKTINYELPILMNSHSFDKTDIYNNSKTIYSKFPSPNPEFSGTSLLEFLQEKDHYFKNEYGKKFVFDGDTIEFMTQNFYKTNVQDCVNELINIKKEFILKLRNIFENYKIFENYGTINFSNKNHGFAIFLTNLNNLAIFNNMTYHFNFTLPTKLNKDGNIEDMKNFCEIHGKAIKILQFITPLFIAKYGSPDILSNSDYSLFSKSSQRCAVSRYIGVGTYNTNNMTKGKLLVTKFQDLDVTKLPFFWYNQYYKECAYINPNIIGYDFNFNKFLNHGIEFRIFEYFPEEFLEEILKFMIYLFDHTYAVASIKNPIYNKVWNNLVFQIIKNGNQYVLNYKEIEMYECLLDIKIKNNNPTLCLNEIMSKMEEKYKNCGYYSKFMIKN